MVHTKRRLLSESVKFIEVCQKCLLSGKINAATYVLLSDVKFDFLKNFLKTEIYDVYIEKDFLYRIKNLFTINCLIRGYCLPDVNKDVH